VKFFVLNNTPLLLNLRSFLHCRASRKIRTSRIDVTSGAPHPPFRGSYLKYGRNNFKHTSYINAQYSQSSRQLVDPHYSPHARFHRYLTHPSSLKPPHHFSQPRANRKEYGNREEATDYMPRTGHDCWKARGEHTSNPDFVCTIQSTVSATARNVEQFQIRIPQPLSIAYTR
jgi:hypothetical protein